MKKQNSLFRLISLVTLIAISIVSVYAQASKTTMGPAGRNPTEAMAAARSDGQPMVKDYQKLLDWLNANPMAIMAGGPGNGGGCKFEYKLLAVDMSAVESFKNSCPFDLVMPPKLPETVFTAGAFTGTVFIPKQTQAMQAKDLHRPDTVYRGERLRAMKEGDVEPLKNARLALFDLATGRMEAQATTDEQGSYKLSGISPGSKALFVSGERGDLFFVSGVEACGRGAGPNGKGCTEMGPGGRYPNAQFTLAPEVGNAYHSYGRLKWMR
ncbi:MAG TPA: carboxypeptidase-like regulatory domain-containing protein [Pyrinomonadaceae bacterium]|nr:carboxypeptidase-like regulatory domain-containing protein [Pyrinomonadaceae bacterium]